VVLDAVQAGVVAQPAGTKLLLLGEAGFGKTTVALHRLARLRREAPGLHAAVLVPTEGLRRLTVELLEKLGVDDAHVWCFDDWAAAEARRAFPDIPLQTSQNTPAGVIRLKRHPALRAVLEQVARQPPVLDDEAPRHGLPHGRVRHGELEHVFGDAALMARVAAASGGAVTGVAVAEVLAHTHVQFSPPAKDAYAHVRKDARATADGRGLDEGTPTEDADTVDAEDHAVLFELDRLRAAARGERATAVSGYDVLVLDEAQELAPLELALAGRSLAAGGTLVVAGDAAQQVDPTSSFLGWEGTLAELGAADAARVTLAVSYRCPPDVTALARRIAGLPTEALPLGAQAEAHILRVELRHELHLTSWLVEALRGLQTQDPSSSIALICRTPEAARSVYRTLRHGLPVKLGLDGEVSLRAGIQVTCVAEVKGLEFDHVVVPDASARSYPATAEARRALYVAVTRATHQLVLASVGPGSPLLSLP
jgi:DNA helicase IV